MKNIITSTPKSIALLITRFIIGGLFVFVGWLKVSHMAGTIAMFTTLGISPFFTYLASYSELIGGLLLILGVCSRFASILLTFVMAVAIWKVAPTGLGNAVFPLVVFIFTLALSRLGSGKYAVKAD